MSNHDQEYLDSIAIIGMAGRFPGAKNIQEFWNNLQTGVESISTFSESELEAELDAGIFKDPNYVRARAILEDVDLFDAAFFGFNPREAEIMDPQHRLFLESAWEALEDAGYNPETYPGAIGLFASTQMSSYLLSNLYPNRDVLESAGLLAIRIANDRDFLATRVSYKLNLRGPSLCIQTACSSSLVATHLACQSLLDYQCDTALVGGVSINLPQKSGYVYEVGSIYSPDGHCRAFDAKAQGTVTGSGLGIVVLKRLEDAIADGDTIHAVIKGSAINNDGFLKVGYTAPSVQGQAEVIAAAQAVADVDPQTISYIEAHGTGTALGDPVEIAALTQVFRQSTDKKSFCAIGSVKTNIGHLDAAAGVSSLIKTVLALKHQLIPPSLHCSEPNPEIDFPNTPFYVNTKLTPWLADKAPRRAGISSFGVGGTNAHVVLEEAKQFKIQVALPAHQRCDSKLKSKYLVLCLSAKTESALDTATHNLIAHLQQHPELNLADVAFTLHVGRKAFDYRRMLVCHSREEAIASLETSNSSYQSGKQQVAFMFPGQGAQYVNMARELYQTEASFRQEIDRCAEFLQPHLGLDLRTVLYPSEDQTETATKQLQQTFITQPALFVVEYALAKLWMKWGIQPQMMIGHSIGEYVAACLAGVFSLEDALSLVATRGRLMQSLPSGTMLAVSLSELQVKPLLGDKLSLAAVNGPSLCVVSGTTEAINALQVQLTADGVECRHLHTSHAFHSAMMEPILKAFGERLQQVRLQPPQIPYLSNLTGTWITVQDATDPSYWVKHLRSTVRFGDGITALLQKFKGIALEVGPGRTLSTLARQYSSTTTEVIFLTSLRHPREQQADVEFMLDTLGKLWLAGATIDWTAFYADEQRQRLPLPTYPFERQRYWIEAPNQISQPAVQQRNQPQLTPRVQHSRPQLRNNYVAPSTATEQAIARIWQELLGIQQVGVKDNFFELGGHSLLATQVVSRIRDTLQTEVALDSLFAAATVAELAKQIDIQQQSKQNHSTIPRVARDEALPLSFAQARLWFLQQIEPTDTSYNLPFAVRLTGKLDLAILEQSFNEIVRRHEVLRTTFITVDGKPSQAIPAESCANTPAQPLPLAVLNLEELPATEQETEVQRLIREQAQQPFDLSQDSLIRLGILRLNAAEHVIYLTMHHTIADGWSIGVLMRELVSLYQAIPLPELPIQYADFAVWQRQWLQGEVWETQMSYWKQQASNIPVLKLSTDRPRSPIQTFRGARQYFLIPPQLTKGLNQLSQQEGATLFMTLLAVFKTLLYRYTSQEDFAIGSPIANRNRSEIEPLIGCFVNTLVLRTDLSGNPTFRQLLARVREVAVAAYAHQDLPFEKLVEEVQPERDISHTPLFQVMFALQNTPLPTLEMQELTLSQFEFDSGTAQFDLSVDISEGESGLRGWFEYNTDLFDGETIARMAKHFQNLVESIVATPEQRLSDLQLLEAQQRHQLLVEWNDTQKDYPQVQCIQELFEQQVERTPDAIAVVFRNSQLTYRELNQRANQLSHHLKSLGVGSEVLVGIYMERCTEMVVSVLAVLKAGGAYVPLDPAYSQERLAFMLENTEVSVLLTQAWLKENLPDHQAKVVYLDTNKEHSQESVENPISETTAQNLAYVIYTSGSTGIPKGVTITHSSIVNAYLAWEDAYSLASATKSHLQMASFSFDVFTGDLVRALCSGAKLVLCPRELLLMPEQLYALMRSEQVDCAEFVPAVLMNLLSYLETTQQSLDFMRLLVVGSDTWYMSGYEQIKRFCGLQTRLINSYGVSEATIDSSYFETAEINLLVERLVPIGRPFANSQIYLLDAYLQPVPVGVVGEVYIGGAGLARGYLHRPDLTAQKFIPHPWSSESGARLYKTGDLGRYLEDGNIELLGRADYQVKIRGFRIELGEIEVALSQHPSIRETVVDVTDDKRLVAYVVPIQEQKPTTSELRIFLTAKIPEYMVPSAFVMLDALPLNSNGKVDRRALPAPEWERELEKSFVAPRTPVEEQLAAIWSQVLGLECVGVYDNFFELGGDSILSIQIVAKANQAGLHLTPKDLFQHRAIADLAVVVGTTATIQAEQGLITGSVPLTPIQRWFFDQELLDAHHWNQAILFTVPQSLNPALLEQAVHHLLLHHDALRMRFSWDEQAGWQQFIADVDSTLPFVQEDISTLAEVEQVAAIEARATALQASLDLANGPLLRMAFFNLGADTGRLLIVIHHLVVDGVSWRILLEDLQTAYQQLVSGETVVLPAKTTSFKHWAHQLLAYAQSVELEDYWLSEKTVAPLPSDFSQAKGTNTVATSCVVSVTLSNEETKALLQEVPAAYHTQINDVLLTALVQTFIRWTGSDSLLVDLEGHGREEIVDGVDVSRTVGWFTTVFPVLLQLQRASDPGEALKSIKEQLRRIPNKGIGYGLLRYLAQNGIAEKLQELPQAMVSFNYLGQIDQTHAEPALLQLAQESTGPSCSPRGNRSYLIEIDGSLLNGQLHMEWTYSQNVHHHSTIEVLAQDFIEELRSLITHCQTSDSSSYTPSDFPDEDLSAEDLDTILAQLS
ncbi:MAG: amino acid adenylation domain-containing protein [Nostoc sp.]|uniref:non-ribosomal peptide synthetase/type I polyketide synthase n=1 Tax=Nostoc sp. TaxID=1180 RepID=UPI002FEF8CA0